MSYADLPQLSLAGFKVSCYIDSIPDDHFIVGIDCHI